MTESAESAVKPERLKRPKQLDELSPDQTVAVILRLAMEICVLRDRIRTHERLLEQKDVFAADDVDSYQPDSDENAARGQARTELIAGLIRDLSE